MHFAAAAEAGVYVNLGDTVFSPQFFKLQQAMHQRMGQTLTLEIEDDRSTVWSVRIGRGDFVMLLAAVAMAIENEKLIAEGGSHNARNN